MIISDACEKVIQPPGLATHSLRTTALQWSGLGSPVNGNNLFMIVPVNTCNVLLSPPRPPACTLFLDEMRTTAFCYSVKQVTTYCTSPWSHPLPSPGSQYTVSLSKPQNLRSKLSIRFKTCDPNKAQGWRVSSFVTMGLPNTRNYHVCESFFFN